jgi:hypothetical protein
MPEKNFQSTNASKIRIITQVLTTALKLWLRSQVSEVSQLEVEIKASDRQILSGRIPSVSIFATNAVYQGLLVTQIQIAAENIRVNIGSILKGQPLRLLEIVPVVGDLIVDEKDLNSSLSSDLLSSAFNDVLVKLLPEYSPESQPINWQKILLENNQIILRGIQLPNTQATPLEVCVGLQLVNTQVLQLTHIYTQHDQGALLEGNGRYNLDLGSDASIRELTLTPGKLVCHGRINVNP